VRAVAAEKSLVAAQYSQELGERLPVVNLPEQRVVGYLVIQDLVVGAPVQPVMGMTNIIKANKAFFMTNETLFFIILLMFIGASPGSCGGGIKTTSLATLFVLGTSRFRGHERPQLFKRTISYVSVGRATSVIMLSMIVVCIGIMLLLMTEIGEVAHPQSRGKFLELLFEAVSAFGTVGLSTGITAGLSVMGKIIISGIMFVGRLGPLVVGMAVSRDAVSRYHYAEETIMVG